jgi:hypothetical protein
VTRPGPRPRKTSPAVDSFDDVPASTRAWVDAMIAVALERLLRERAERAHPTGQERLR